MITHTTVGHQSPCLHQGCRMTQQPVGPRFLMWVDGVGGFLVCLGEQVRIGQAAAQVELPILGDLSRHHVTASRQGESYVLEPAGPTWKNGQVVTEPQYLRDGDAIRLGGGCHLRFRHPHPFSATARLDIVSSHRTQPAADGVLLMASSCILGPGSQSHIVCRHWTADVVLVRQGQSLACHATVPISVDGREYEHHAPLTLDSRIQGDDFCLSLERID